MKDGWTYKKLGEVCCKSSNIKWDDVSNDASYKYIDLTSVYRTDLRIHDPQIITKESAPSRAKQIVKVGDVIFATTRPTLRRVSLIDDKHDGALCSTGFCVLRPNTEISSKWIFYCLQNNGFYNYIEPLQTGASYPAVTDGIVKGYVIPVPPLDEQKRIVERLDAAFENIDKLKANAEKLLAEAQTLFQKSLAKAMEPKEGWEEKNIGELTDSCLGKMLDKQKNKGEYQPYLRNINVRWGEFDLSDILEMKFEDGEDERYGIQKGDLIICEGGEPGRCAIWEGKMENMKIQKALHRVRSKGEILNRYLYFSIMYYAQSGFLEKFESGATIKHLTGEALRKIPLSYPPLAEQQRIVERLDALNENIRKYEEIQRQIISECDALKQALLRKVFE